MEDKKKEFEKLYRDLYTKYYNKYEQMRKKSKSNFIIAVIFFVIAFFAIVVSRDIEEYSTIVLILFIVSSIIGYFFLTSGNAKRKRYEKTYKQDVITEFINALDLKLNYNSIVENQEEINSQYKRACFDLKEYDIWNYNDHIYGNINEKIQLDVYDVFHEINKKRNKRYSI